MKVLKPNCSGASDKQLALLMQQIDDLQNDFAVLQKEVKDFGSSFNSASASITKLTTDNLTANKAKITSADIELLKAKAEKLGYVELKTVEANPCIGKFKGGLTLDVIATNETGTVQTIKLAAVNNTLIAMSDNESLVNSIKLHNKAGEYFIEAVNVSGKPLTFMIHAASDNYTEKAEIPAVVDETKDVVIKRAITLAGDVVYDNTSELSFTDVIFDNIKLLNTMKVEDYTLKADYPLMEQVDEFTKVEMNEGFISFNNGEAQLTFKNGKLIKAVTGRRFSIVEQGTSVYLKEISTYPIDLKVDYSFSIDEPVITPNIIELPNSLTICKEGRTYFNVLSFGEIESAGILLNKSIEIKSPGLKDVKMNLRDGVVILKIIKSDDGEVLASATVTKNTTTNASTMVNFSQKELGILTHFKEDTVGNFYIETSVDNAILYYTSTGVKGAPLEVSIEPTNLNPMKLDHTVIKQQHTVILGDNSLEYGMIIDGELKASLIPLPGTSSFEDLVISHDLTVNNDTHLLQTTNANILNTKTLNVENATTLNDTTINGNLTAKNATLEDVTLHNLEVNGTAHIGDITTLDSDLFVGGTTTLTDTDVLGNLNITGDIYQQGKAFETHAEQVNVSDNNINLRYDAKTGLGNNEYSGLKVQNFDGNRIDLNLAVDQHGEARLGKTGSVLEPLLTRDEAVDMQNNSPIIWDSTGRKAKTLQVPERSEGKVLVYNGADTAPTFEKYSTAASYTGTKEEFDVDKNITDTDNPKYIEDGSIVNIIGDKLDTITLSSKVNLGDLNPITSDAVAKFAQIIFDNDHPVYSTYTQADPGDEHNPNTLFNNELIKSKWQLVNDPAFEYLYTVSTPEEIGRVRNESVPNIKGSVSEWGDRTGFTPHSHGAFKSLNPNHNNILPVLGEQVPPNVSYLEASFDASKTSSGNGQAYKDGAKVRPNSRGIGIWERTE